jgi:hypothetical protein
MNKRKLIKATKNLVVCKKTNRIKPIDTDPMPVIPSPIIVPINYYENNILRRSNRIRPVDSTINLEDKKDLIPIKTG